ncbi:MAG: hypothetical protein M5U30_13305 [Burkholderiaceae bacterium]|nr:hypothetical protein [Burkholderiaceae bacterium]
MTGKLGIGDLAAMGLGNVGIGPLNVGNVLDTVDFVKKAWTSFGVPSGFTPTLDLEELDKRIADLKAVEQWLTLNMTMLQGTIQALEIQRGTIATLKAFGAPVEAAAPAAPAAQAIASVLGGAAPPDGRLGTAPAATGAAGANAGGEGGARAAPGGTKRARPSRREERGAKAPAAGALADPGLSPSAWWNLLQSQFNQVAAAALSGVGLSGANPARPHSASRPRPRLRAAARDAAHPRSRSPALRRRGSAASRRLGRARRERLARLNDRAPSTAGPPRCMHSGTGTRRTPTGAPRPNR